jgi:hypothetical protein
MDPFTLAMIVGGGQLIGAKLSRDAAKRERDNHFVNLRESARRAGVNPLTALRATGGGGYGQYVPLLSRSPLGEGISAGTSFYANMQRDMYFTRQNQAHEMRLNKMSNRAVDRRASMNANKEFDYGAVERIKVQFGGKTLMLKSNVARRLKILPGDDLMPGELSEISGELWGEVVSALGTEAAAEVLGVSVTELLNDDSGEWSIDRLVQETKDAINNTPIGTLTRGWTAAGNAIDKGTIWLKQPNPNAMRTVITRGRQHGGKAGM